ncbi:cytochrome P450 [Gloeophyllum trabeum ATCC 11539]|uniref:Cytochrome P450 n=1 Tax=Gloeophyllum trabeum (strain ATCC 11539 / FP-39264 / Madison 617) TaxID=670483 RepID=S7Q1X9_GLOTA|nr:cytochrome P450 [Gloeophyllum trabeum ATCC 11539]EPQ54006.1 cytochrome P450 [Gloeophyllum trabeum ATCC 11539]
MDLFTGVWYLCTGLAVLTLLAVVRTQRVTPNATLLRGPPSSSILWGVRRSIRQTANPGALYERWERLYGGAYEITGVAGSKEVILTDSMALSHFYAKDGSSYARTTYFRLGVEKMSSGSHSLHIINRQRKNMLPAFTVGFVRRLCPVFLETAHKVRKLSSACRRLTIDLDAVGRAGYSYDFGALRDARGTLVQVLENISSLESSVLLVLTFLMTPAFPRLVLLMPTAFNKAISALNAKMTKACNELTARAKEAADAGAISEDGSIIGLLHQVGSAHIQGGCRIQHLRQMKTLLVAGYESTAATMTWILVRLSQAQDIQAKLREELLTNLGTADPDWASLTTGLPYLDAVVQEVLRLHPAVLETWREATTDDTLPLGTAITTRDGQIVDRITIRKGTRVTVPISCVNQAESIWGADASEFKPERWLRDGGIPSKAQKLQGHRHILTFLDGPRMCLGRNFALAEMKAVVSVLIRHYAFSLRDGPHTKLVTTKSIVPRATVAGEIGDRVPFKLRIHRIE